MSTRFLRGSVIHNRHDPLDDGLVGEWRFDKNTGESEFDHSGYSNNGTITTTFERGGSRVGLRAGQSDAGEFVVNCGSGPSLKVQAHTIEWYVTLSHLNVALASRAVNALADGYGWLIDGGGLLTLYYVDAGGGKGWYKSAFAISANTWTHIVGTWDVGTARYYYDGVYQDSDATANGNIVHVGADFTIGHRNLTSKFRGDFALCRVYNRVLTANEVRARYQLVRKRMQTFGGEWSLDRYAVVAAEEERAPRNPAYIYQVPAIV